MAERRGWQGPVQAAEGAGLCGRTGQMPEPGGWAREESAEEGPGETAKVTSLDRHGFPAWD